MKKLALAVTAIAALSGQAFAADMAVKARPAPPPVAVYNWTGCNIYGGGGYGWYTAETREVVPLTGAIVTTQGDTGGRGWLGQVGAGCDYQFSGPYGNWVIGAFGDYTFSDVKGDHIGPPVTVTVGELKQDYSWAVGGRVGYLVNPNFLSYVNAGYTETHFKDTIYFGNGAGAPALGVAANTLLPAATYKGWFVGSGFEYALNFFSVPGLFLKTEYRYSEFDRKQLSNQFTATRLPTGTAETVKPFSQSVITSLVWRFNWGGTPVVAKY
jgi:outer membrane immunogenic protein